VAERTLLPVAWRSVGAILPRAILLAAAAGALRALGAQDYAFTPAVQWQARAEAATSGRGNGALAGGGFNVPAGYYVRLGLEGMAGVLSQGGGTRTTGRVDFSARFLFDPFAEQRAGWYGGAGVSAIQSEREWRPYLLLVLGREGPTAGRWRTAIETGIGGGVRLGVVLRRARQNGR
jgi:hypothetical protein